MTSPLFDISLEQPEDRAETEMLAAQAFGPGRFTRTAFRLREGRDAELHLSFVARKGAVMVGSVKLTRIKVGEKPGLLLGPLVVAPNTKNQGVGQALLNRAVEAARQEQEAFILLVGDHSYYARAGFEQVPSGTLILPGPADPARILVCYLEEDARKTHMGAVTRW